MTKADVAKILEGVLETEAAELDSPTAEDWRILEEYFGTIFPAEFKFFIELMAKFSFPGDIYNVTNKPKTNGNDTILMVYEIERSESKWPENLIPFYGIGNGDYFAINASEGINSGVYYRYHEDGRVEKYMDSFENWLINLPVFLDG